MASDCFNGKAEDHPRRPRCAHQTCRQASDNVHANRVALIPALHWGGRCATLSFDYRSFTKSPRRNVRSFESQDCISFTSECPVVDKISSPQSLHEMYLLNKKSNKWQAFTLRKEGKRERRQGGRNREMGRKRVGREGEKEQGKRERSFFHTSQSEG